MCDISFGVIDKVVGVCPIRLKNPNNKLFEFEMDSNFIQISFRVRNITWIEFEILLGSSSKYYLDRVRNIT
jgi:hypothetical protein